MANLAPKHITKEIKKYIHYTIDYYSRHYSVFKTVKAFVYLNERTFKRLNMDLSVARSVVVNGCGFNVIPNDEGISAELIMFKTHEPLSTELLKLQLKPGMVCLDAGSNIGYYALLERKLVGPSGRVIAIEPSPLNYSYLLQNISSNDYDDIMAFNIALSDSNGEVLFNVSEYSNLCKVVVDDTKNQSLCSTIYVPAKSVDSFVKENSLSRIDIIRMDVEGYEYQIIKGASETLSAFRPLLFIEIHKNILGQKRTKEFLVLIKNTGYEIQYYIPRECNLPWIGNFKDIKKIKISNLIEDLCSFPDCFHLLLRSTSTR